MIRLIGREAKNTIAVTQEVYNTIDQALNKGKLVLYDDTEKEIIIVDWVDLEAIQAGG